MILLPDIAHIVPNPRIELATDPAVAGCHRIPQQVEQLEQRVMDKIRSELPDVNWLHNFATLGPYDYVGIFEAPDVETATRVSMLVQIFGHATSEIWAATEWQRFRELLHDMPRAA